jgi:hypothetical protein
MIPDSEVRSLWAPSILEILLYQKIPDITVAWSFFDDGDKMELVLIWLAAMIVQD